MKQALLLLTLSAAAFGADLTLVSHTGKCIATVPGDWTVGAVKSLGNSPDKKVSLVISNPTMEKNFEELKVNVQKIYTDDKVTKSTASEFEMEGKSGNGRPNVYRAIVSGGTICIGELQYQSGTATDARKLIQTLKSK